MLLRLSAYASTGRVGKMTEARDLDLRHYSRDEIISLDERHHDKIQREDKPNGFWVSVGDAWDKWCREEQFALHRLAYCYSVTLTPWARILVLDTPEQLIDLASDSPVQRYGHQYPQWSSIYEGYDGIIISPYQWSMRLELRWYYSWDVASGCIWSVDAISALTLIKETEEVL